LNHLEVPNSSVPNINHVEEVRRSISSMVPTAIDPNDSLRLHLPAIFTRDLPGELRETEKEAPKMIKGLPSANIHVCYRHFESIYSDIADQNIRLNAIACPKTNNSLQ
jgi:hypothetical protein